MSGIVGEIAPVLIGGSWISGEIADRFTSTDPASGEQVGTYPVSGWNTVDSALNAGTAAYLELEDLGPTSWAAFLDALAATIERHAESLVGAAHRETALAASPRLAQVELPRTTDQLRQAAAAARDLGWRQPVLSPTDAIARYRAPIPGVVVVFGPNNFPFAFNAVNGGDFAAAVATGHPVLAKGNPGHPETTRLLARCAVEAADDAGVPRAVLQMVYDIRPDDGLRLVADRRVAAVAFTGSKHGGLALKGAADCAGTPAYFEMASVNPVVILPIAWKVRGGELAEEIAASVVLGNGQFCTKPGIVFVNREQAEAVGKIMIDTFRIQGESTLLGEGVRTGLEAAVEVLTEAGAEVRYQAENAASGCSYATTLLQVDSETFIAAAELQTEAFGNVTMLVTWDDVASLLRCLGQLDGNLTATIYVDRGGGDDRTYAEVAPLLRERVGRLLENKPPTGVAVVPAMNHGGPYPSTGHPGFTSVGIPASLNRFTMLQCFDNVADHRLPAELQADNPLGIQRDVDGCLTTDPVTWGPIHVDN